MPIKSPTIALARDIIRKPRNVGGTTVTTTTPGTPVTPYQSQLMNTFGAGVPTAPEIDPVTGQPKAPEGTVAPGGPMGNPMVAAAMEMGVGSGGGGQGGEGTSGGPDGGPSGDSSAGGSPAGDGGGTMGGAMARGGMAGSGGVTTKVHVGPIHSPVAGRTDHLPIHVPSGAYVIPADIISAMGEGNTMAGFKVANSIFSKLPYMSGLPGEDAQLAIPGKAAGGMVDEENAVPIVAAGGEYVISPQDVERIGEGDLDRGHKELDIFVKSMRAKTIKTLQNLPGPKKD